MLLDALYIFLLFLGGILFLMWGVNAILDDSIFSGLSMVSSGLALVMLGFLIISVGTKNSYNRQAFEAIKVCEAELPRHLNCRAVITAEVIEASE